MAQGSDCFTMNRNVGHAILLVAVSLCLLTGCSGRKAETAKPGYAPARAAEKVGQGVKASTNLDEVIRLNPADPTAYYKRGQVRWRQKDIVGALADCNEAIKLKPDFAEAYCQRGNVTLTQGRLDHSGSAARTQAYVRQAVADFDQAVKLKPAFALAFFSRAMARQVQGDVEKALLDYDQTIMLKPRPEVYFDRGYLKQKLGRKEEAIADYRRVLQARPSPALRQHAEAQLKELGAEQEHSPLDVTAPGSSNGQPSSHP